MSRTYTTIQGDMWDSIAKKTMGSGSYTGTLLWANRAYTEIYEFPAGVVLTIPETPTSKSSDLPPWKR